MQQPRFVSLLALAAALVLVTGPSLGEEADATGPVAVFPEFDHDFGDVVRGDKLTYSFVVKNDGDELLVIESVQPT